MKNTLLFLFLLTNIFLSAQSIPETEVTLQGVKMPRLTTTDRNAVTPATNKKGLLVYDLGKNSYFYFDGSIWHQMANSSSNRWIDSITYLTYKGNHIIVSDSSNFNLNNEGAKLSYNTLQFVTDEISDNIVYSRAGLSTETFSGSSVSLSVTGLEYNNTANYSKLDQTGIETGINDLNGAVPVAKIHVSPSGGEVVLSNSSGENTIIAGQDNGGFLQIKNAIGDTLVSITNNNLGNAGLITLTGIQSKIEIEGLDLGYKPGGHMGIDGDIVPYNSSTYDIGNNVVGQNWDQVVANQFLTFSDARLKQNIKSVPKGSLNKIMKLNPVTYQYKISVDVDQRQRFGLLAQDVQKIFPEVVVTEDVDVDNNGNIIRTKSENLTMNYIELIPHLIKALQEQQKIIDDLKTKVSLMEVSDKK